MLPTGLVWPGTLLSPGQYHRLVTAFGATGETRGVSVWMCPSLCAGSLYVHTFECVCVCVCVCERHTSYPCELHRLCVCVCVCVCGHTAYHHHSTAYVLTRNKTYKSNKIKLKGSLSDKKDL